MIRRRLPIRPPVNYQVVRCNENWPDHTYRAMVTGAALGSLRAKVVCDPACGDGSILTAGHSFSPIAMGVLGDISAPGITAVKVPFQSVRHVGPAEETLGLYAHYDAVVLTEFLEHIANPDDILRLARDRADGLVASSPILEPPDYVNDEHLWEWDVEAFGSMLNDAGWVPQTVMQIDFPAMYGAGWAVYRYQVWTAR